MLRNDLKPWKVYSIFMHIKQFFHNVKMLVHYESSDVHSTFCLFVKQPKFGA